MAFSFWLNAGASLLNVGIMFINAGSNPTLMVVNGACAIFSACVAMSCLKRV